MADKKVTFSNNISDIYYFEYDDKEEYIKEKKGNNWQETCDLIYRNFKKPYSEGGCDNNWFILEKKLQLLDEPYWMMIGQFWNILYPGLKRYEELNQFVRVRISKNIDDISDGDSFSDSFSDSDSDENVV
jgi:hypothetical protein